MFAAVACQQRAWLTFKSYPLLLLVSFVQVGAERYNLFTGCPQAKTSTIVLRGGSEQFIDEAERSLHDAIMIVRRALKHAHVVAGGGAIDMEVRPGCASAAVCICGFQHIDRVD